ncbi:MAG: hypothetical protein NTW52_09640 [Planctomycetota bacterium]|nr:hypothetical protein [Planctomycetota bacterium]
MSNSNTPNSKIAPALHASWQIEVDSSKQACVAPSQDLLHKFLTHNSLWIRSDKDFATTQRKSNAHASQMAWITPCENAKKAEFESPLDSTTDHDSWVQIALIAFNAMPSAIALSSYAAIELACYEITAFEDEEASDEPSLERLRIHWPLDVETTSHMSFKIEILRALTEDDKPIGLAVPIVSLSDEFFESLGWLLNVKADWIHWLLPAAVLGDDHEANEYLLNDPFIVLESIQKWQTKSTTSDSKTPAIVIDFPWKNGYQAAEMIRKGANAVVLPECSEIIQIAKKQATSPSTRDLTFPGSLLGATLGYTPSSFLPPKSQTSNEINSDTPQALDVFYRQFKLFLKWSES